MPASLILFLVLMSFLSCSTNLSACWVHVLRILSRLFKSIINELFTAKQIIINIYSRSCSFSWIYVLTTSTWLSFGFSIINMNYISSYNLVIWAKFNSFKVLVICICDINGRKVDFINIVAFFKKINTLLSKLKILPFLFWWPANSPSSVMP